MSALRKSLEIKTKFLKKATVAFAAMSMVTAPIAASAAAPRFDDLRVVSKLGVKMGQSEDEVGTETWLLALIAAAAAIAAIVIAADGSDRTPTSP